MPNICRLLTFCLLAASGLGVTAQELNAKVAVNHQKVQGTSTSIFENLQTSLNQLMNEFHWTNQQYAPHERIACSFNITVNQYTESENKFDCTLTVQSSRPIFNSTYTSTVFNFQDAAFSFTFQEFDQLEFRLDQIDNELTALMAYYAYLIIGWDLDTMSPLGGAEALRNAQTIVNGAQSFTSKGWKAFEGNKNRYALINDYLDGGLETLRQLQYQYYRNGMDEMATNAERGRANITTALELLKKAKEDKPMSSLPQLFTEIKRDELVNIYKGKGTANEKEAIYEMLMSINPSQSNYWRRIRQ